MIYSLLYVFTMLVITDYVLVPYLHLEVSRIALVLALWGISMKVD